MNLTPAQATLLVLAAPLALTLFLHLLIHVFVFVRLPKAAAWIARNTPTVTALLPAAIDQLIGGPNLVTFAKDLDDASKREPSNSLLLAWAIRAKKIAGLPLSVLALVLVSCTGTTAVRSAIEASNAASQLEQQVGLDLEQTCVAPMRAAKSQDELNAVAKKCDSKVAAYAGERRAHLAVIAAITAAESPDGITISTILDLVKTLSVSIATLVKEYAQ